MSAGAQDRFRPSRPISYKTNYNIFQQNEQKDFWKIKYFATQLTQILSTFF